ncbi:gcvPB [Acrasis kona]|uniref:GcvPB n=1 Tax=Acrasis kona TaxID=1008807 RepID=A0AAW2ZB85_9EUKA
MKQTGIIATLVSTINTLMIRILNFLSPPRRISFGTGRVIDQKDLKFNINDLIDQVYKIYTAKSSKEQHPIVDKLFVQEPTFEDPMFRVVTIKDFKAQFASLPVIFERVNISPAKHIVFVDKDDNIRVEVENKQVYYSRLTKNSVELNAITSLHIDRSSGKIIKLQDVWKERGKDIIHLFGIYTYIKQPLGKFVSVLLRLSGIQ